MRHIAHCLKAGGDLIYFWRKNLPKNLVFKALENGTLTHREIIIAYFNLLFLQFIVVLFCILGYLGVSLKE